MRWNSFSRILPSYSPRVLAEDIVSSVVLITAVEAMSVSLLVEFAARRETCYAFQHYMM